MHDAITVEWLRRIEQKLDALPATIAATMRSAATERRGTIGDADRRALAILLPEISDAVGSCAFTVAYLLRHANCSDAVLRAGLERATGQLDAGTAKRIGKLLRRAENFIVDGRHVERVDATREGVLWCVADGGRVFEGKTNSLSRNAA